MLIIKFVFEIEPVQQIRPRARRFRDKVIMYDPKAVKVFKRRIGKLAHQMMKESGCIRYEGKPLTVDVWFFRPVQEKISKKEKARRIRGTVLPIVKPDCDNYIKSLLDGMNGVVWKDDALITDIFAHKRYSDKPRIEITIMETEAN